MDTKKSSGKATSFWYGNLRWATYLLRFLAFIKWIHFSLQVLELPWGFEINLPPVRANEMGPFAGARRRQSQGSEAAGV